MLTIVYLRLPRPMASACSMVWTPCCLSIRLSRSVGSLVAVTCWLLMMSTQAWSSATGSVEDKNISPVTLEIDMDSLQKDIHEGDMVNVTFDGSRVALFSPEGREL